MTFRLGDVLQGALPKVAAPRAGGRAPDQIRAVTITPSYLKHAEGSALIEVGDTRVVCAVSVEDRVPPFLKGSGEGWITAEYGMLPRATTTRNQREVSKGRPTGRTAEIQRLIGRSLRAAIDPKGFGERTLWVDCDVVQADGGTRTASITGAFVALVLAFRRMQAQRQVGELPVCDFVAATSVGRIDGALLLDLDYSEDSEAEVDMNVVKTGRGAFVEVQGTAEDHPFAQSELDAMLAIADKGIQDLVAAQQKVLGDLPLRARKA